jgi:hypothetical protein
VFACDQLVGGPLQAGFAATGLVPLQSASAAWTAVLFVLGGYGVAQLLEDQREVTAHDHISHLVVLACTFMVIQLVTAGWHPIATAAVALVIAGIAAIAYVRAHRAIRSTSARSHAPPAPTWIGLPFALLAGFTIITAMPAIHAAIPNAGTGAAVALVLAATIVVVALAVELRDPALPGFAAWLLVGICAATGGDVALATTTLLAGGTCAAVAIVLVASRLGAAQASAGTSRPRARAAVASRARRPAARASARRA